MPAEGAPRRRDVAVRLLRFIQRGNPRDGAQKGGAQKAGMSTAETEPAGIDLQVLADLDAVMKRISDGAAVDPETSPDREARRPHHGGDLPPPRRHGRRPVPGVAS
jgi:hypothetical protein